MPVTQLQGSPLSMLIMAFTCHFYLTFFPEFSVLAVQSTMDFLSCNNQLLQEAMTKAQAGSQKTFDKRRRGELNLQLGYQVWHSMTNLRLACPSRNLEPKSIGLFPVKRKLNELLYELSLPDSLKIHPVFHVSLLKPAVSDPFPYRGRPPEPVLIDGSEEFEVEAIVDCRKRHNQVQYLIKWKGYGPEDNSWEPKCNIHARRLIHAFFLAHPEKKGQLGIRRLPIRRGQCQGLTAARWRCVCMS